MLHTNTLILLRDLPEYEKLRKLKSSLLVRVTKTIVFLIGIRGEHTRSIGAHKHKNGEQWSMFVEICSAAMKRPRVQPAPISIYISAESRPCTLLNPVLKQYHPKLKGMAISKQVREIQGHEFARRHNDKQSKDSVQHLDDTAP